MFSVSRNVYERDEGRGHPVLDLVLGTPMKFVKSSV